MHVVQFAVGHVDETRNVAPQIEQRMHLDRRLGRTEMRPWEHRQAQIDGGGIQRVHRVRQFQPQRFVEVKLARLHDQTLGKRRVDAPVAQFVGVRQRRTAHRFAKAHVVELGRLCGQADLDVPKAFSIGQLGKCHGAILLGTRERLHAPVAAKARNVSGKCCPRQKVHQLSEQGLADMHANLRVKTRKIARMGYLCSNRHHPSSREIPRQYWASGDGP